MLCCIQTEGRPDAAGVFVAIAHTLGICLGGKVATPMAKMALRTRLPVATAALAIHISAGRGTTYRMVQTAY